MEKHKNDINDYDIFVNNLNKEINEIKKNIDDLLYISEDIKNRLENLDKENYLKFFNEILEITLEGNLKDKEYSYIELIIPEIIKFGLEKNIITLGDINKNFENFFSKIFSKYDNNIYFVRDLIPLYIELGLFNNNERYIKDVLNNILKKMDIFIKLYYELNNDHLDMKKRIEFNKLKNTGIYKYYLTDTIPAILNYFDFEISELNNSYDELKKIYGIV